MSDGIDFRHWSRRAAEWGADYLEHVAERPVRPGVAPGDVLARLPPSPPEAAEPMEAIFADFEELIPDAMTHWQHPRFFAYFQSNAAPAAIVAEQLAGAMAAQCMLWQTSPAATELETRMMSWLGQAVGLPMQDGPAPIMNGFKGTMQDTASSATLAAMLTMRELATQRRGNATGLFGEPRLRVYASGRTHSSIPKALWVAGLGDANLVRVPTGAGPMFAMDINALDAAIRDDREAGMVPAGIVACVGGTGVGATDDVDAVCEVARRHGLYVHVDAAWAGSAMVCPEFRHLWSGVERADSVVLNPHKWLGTGMECSAHFVKDSEALTRTLSIKPAYLQSEGEVTDYSDWSVQLGRRFRALKVWFLLRAYGLEGLRGRIRDHVRWSQALCERLRAEPDLAIVTEPVLSLFTFAHRRLDARRLCEAINEDGRIYLTASEHDGTPVIRFVAGQFDTGEADVEMALDVIREVAARLDA